MIHRGIFSPRWCVWITCRDALSFRLGISTASTIHVTSVVNEFCISSSSTGDDSHVFQRTHGYSFLSTLSYLTTGGKLSCCESIVQHQHCVELATSSAHRVAAKLRGWVIILSSLLLVVRLVKRCGCNMQQ